VVVEAAGVDNNTVLAGEVVDNSKGLVVVRENSTVPFCFPIVEVALRYVLISLLLAVDFHLTTKFLHCFPAEWVEVLHYTTLEKFLLE